MKKNFIVFMALVMGMCFQTVTAIASSNPTCVLMKFTDDTRFDHIESAATLSDMVMEKLLNSGKFNFKETKFIDQDLEKLLYNERAEEFQNARYAMRWGDYNRLFEGPGFNENRAQSIATATKGQIVSPDIIRSISNQHGAEYLIEGTIINIGTGSWMDDDLAKAAGYVQQASSVLNSFNPLNMLGPVGALARSFNMKVTGIAIQADMRIIKGSTGEVVWHKTIMGKDTQKQYSLMGVVKVGSDKLNNDMYYKAMEVTSTLIANEIIADLDAGKLFL